MGMAIITQERFNKLIDERVADAIRTKKEQSLTDDFGRGRGSFKVRVTRAGHTWFYFRFTDSQGQQKQIPIHIGSVDESQDGKVGWLKAWKIAECWSGYLRDGHRDDLAAYIACKEAEAEAAANAAKAVKAAEAAKTKAGSLRALCNAYVVQLETDGKPSVKEVKNTFRLNVFEAFPDLADTPARQITSKHIGTILGRLKDRLQAKVQKERDDGPKRRVGNAARKLRAFLIAAFNAALAAQEERGDDTPLAGFALDANPAAAIPAKKYKALSGSGTRHLNDDELRVFLAKLNAVTGLAADGVRLCLFTGGQRPTQLLRVAPADFDSVRRTLLLKDIKGQRSEPRPHLVALNVLAFPLVQQLKKTNGHKAYLFALREVQLQPERLSEVVRDIAKAMVDEHTARGPFTLADLRRSAETMLAELGVSKDVRARVLSHGIGGVQDTHYDMHDYLAEKREALDKWAEKLQSLMEIEPEPVIEAAMPSNVVPIRRRGTR
ncbi:site-specific integrase [Pseudogulbenkiania subflava]|uniref:Phage integrase family protein n=1 Tax=Pseudogulbenkiania subflava DSM 22618 TaxID=1123014 RepID=A0A1Y6BCK9_9NEIS|nr:hypothetical protein [Pseudogulbenkiania subflava]SMF04143.1 hypothetical protein SAMN02745746_00930 [Pseudogulbenkiania subflava DSM 22618]